MLLVRMDKFFGGIGHFHETVFKHYAFMELCQGNISISDSIAHKADIRPGISTLNNSEVRQRKENGSGKRTTTERERQRKENDNGKRTTTERRSAVTLGLSAQTDLYTSHTAAHNCERST
jgi:hypothetical protein